MELRELIINIKLADRRGNPPGNPNYQLMSLIADLVEYIGRQGDVIPVAIDDHVRGLVHEHHAALFYRQVEHLRQVGSDAVRRHAWLARGLVILEIDLRSVLNRVPETRGYAQYAPLMLA